MNKYKELLKQSIRYTCYYLNSLENEHPEFYSQSDEVAEMNDFLVEIEDLNDEELNECIIP